MQNNEERIVTPKVYALLLESKETTFLSVQFSYSLEEAFLAAKLEFEKQNPGRVGNFNPLVGSKIGLFTIKSIEELTFPLFESNDEVGKKVIQKVEKIQQETEGVLNGIKKHLNNLNNSDTPDSVQNSAEESPKKTRVSKREAKMTAKNELMSLIVKTKNMELFEKNKSMFTKAEISYLKEHIK